MRLLPILCARCGRSIEGPLGDDDHGRRVHPYDCQNTVVCACCGTAGVQIAKVVETKGIRGPLKLQLHGRCGACGWTDIYDGTLAPHSFNPMWGEIRKQKIDEYRRANGLEDESDGADVPGERP